MPLDAISKRNLENAAAIFGQARLVTTLSTNSLRPRATTTLEAKGPRDSAWRPIATMDLNSYNEVYTQAHPMVTQDDWKRFYESVS